MHFSFLKKKRNTQNKNDRTLHYLSQPHLSPAYFVNPEIKRKKKREEKLKTEYCYSSSTQISCIYRVRQIQYCEFIPPTFDHNRASSQKIKSANKDPKIITGSFFVLDQSIIFKIQGKINPQLKISFDSNVSFTVNKIYIQYKPRGNPG